MQMTFHLSKRRMAANDFHDWEKQRKGEQIGNW